MAVIRQSLDMAEVAIDNATGKLQVDSAAAATGTTNFAPSWTDNVQITAPTVIAKATSLRSLVDLRTCHGGFLNVGVGRYSAAVLNTGLDVVIRRTVNNDALAVPRYGAAYAQFMTDLTFRDKQQLNLEAGYAAGSSSFAYDGTGTGSPTAYVHGDQVCFWGTTTEPAGAGAGAATTEILRLMAPATPMTTDSPSSYAHADNEFHSFANSWSVWLPGGCTYSLIYDASAVTTTSYFMCLATLQRYDKTAAAA